MSQRSSKHRRPSIAGAVVLALFAASCGGSDDNGAPDDTTEDAPGDTTEQQPDETVSDAVEDCVRKLSLSDASELEWEFVQMLCNRNTDAGDQFMISSCGKGSYPEVIMNDGEEHAFFPHGIIRFHPANDLNPSATSGYAPASVKLGTTATDLYVIDEAGAHGDFVRETIQSVTGEPVKLSSLTGPVFENQIADELDLIPASRSSVFVNLSLGTYLCPGSNGPAVLRVALASLQTRVEAAGGELIVVASAGNDGIGSDQLSWPAGFANDGFEGIVESVGSTNAAGDVRSCFSNYQAVTAWAVGEEVYIPGVGNWSGTSFAAPQVLSMLASDDPGQVIRDEPGPPPQEYAVEWIDALGDPHVSSTFCGPADNPYAYDFPAWMNATYDPST